MNDFFEIKSISQQEEDALSMKVQETVSDNEKKGRYDTLKLSEKVAFDLSEVQDESQFLDYYLKVIQRTWAIDINDFDIPIKSGFLGWFEKKVKQGIWRALKFYTFRLFSQQRDFNASISKTLLAMEKDYKNKIKSLKEDLNRLEKK